MDESQLKALLRESGLTDREQAILAASQPAVRLQSRRDKQSPPPIGASKLGGNPDLPNEVAWPERDGRPLSFIAQVSLDGIPVDEPGFSQGGLLSFFYDAEGQPWGYDPKDSDGCRVLHFPRDQGLSRRTCPEELEDEGWFLECSLDPVRHVSLPGWENPSAQMLAFSEEEGESYDEVYESLQGETPLAHQLLGFPSEIQGAMELECQLASNGLYCGDATGYSDPRRDSLEAGAADWRLLLQVDSDQNADMMWGDAGRLYFWIRREDLAELNFDKPWVILQCY